MTDLSAPKARLSSHPWSLYQAKHLTGHTSRRDREGFYSQLLMDDLSKQRYAYDISFVPSGLDSLRASELVFALLDDFNHAGYDRDPATLVCDFVDSFLQESSEGKALLLELHSLPSDRGQAQRRSRRKKATARDDEQLPSLGLIPNWSVKKTRDGLSQASPLSHQRTISIPKTCVHPLELPPRIRSKWTRAVKGLRLIDSSELNSAGGDHLSWEGYEISEAVAAQNLAVATSTSEIGWDGRGTFAELATSQYMAFRQLRFTKFWIEALQESIDFLNRFTTSDSLYGDNAFSFSLTGFPTTGDLAQAMDSIRNGTLTVEKAHHYYLLPKYSSHEPEPTD